MQNAEANSTIFVYGGRVSRRVQDMGCGSGCQRSNLSALLIPSCVIGYVTSPLRVSVPLCSL